MGPSNVTQQSQLIGDPQVAFFNLVHSCFQQAQAASGALTTRHYEIAGQQVQLNFAGSALPAQLTRAIAHLEVSVPAGPPDIEFMLWDGASTHTALPYMLSHYLAMLGEWWDHLTPQGEIREFSGDRIQSAYHLGPNILSVYDRELRVGLYYVADGDQLPYYEIGSPMRTLFHWSLVHAGAQFIHGGAVGNALGGVVLAGRGGSGKSTTALAAVQAGLAYASDDYCVLRAGDPPVVYSLYNTAKLVGEADVERFAAFNTAFINLDRLDDEKAMLFLHEAMPEQVSRGFAVRALVFPRVTGRSALNPISKGAALTRLAPSSMFQLPGAGEGSLKALAEFVRQVPAYELELSDEIADGPRQLLTLLDA